MKESKADLIVHPVRMRIIGLLAADAQMTAQEMSESLVDVPQATLYRHLTKLVKGNILAVVDQTPIRGTIEKVYALSKNQASLTEDDLKEASRDDHMRYFMTFVANLIGDFGRYLDQDQFDMFKDGVGYRQIPLYLSDEEFIQFAHDYAALVQNLVGNKPSPERRRRMLSSIVIPEAQPSFSKEEE